MLNWMKNYQNVMTSEVKPTKLFTDAALPLSLSSPPPPSNLEIPIEATQGLKLIEELEFDCFAFAHKFGENSLLYLMEHLFTKYNFFSELNINQTIFENFMNKIANG